MSKLIDENGVAALIELVKKQTPNTYSKQEIDALVNQSRVSVDGSLSTSSSNPVSNRVVTSELSKKLNSTSVAQVALTGSYNDLKDKPALEEAVPLHIRSITQLDITNWNNKQDVISDLETIRSKANSAILTMPNFAEVATSGSYNDLTDKPTIPDTSNLATKSELADYCPLIEDTRSSAVGTITGVAPFSSLVNGQRILLHCKYVVTDTVTLNLTLSDGTLTGAVNVYFSHKSALNQTSTVVIPAGSYMGFIYDHQNNRWVTLGQADTYSQTTLITQAEINAGTSTSPRAVTPKLLRNNFYLKSETDNEFVHASGPETFTGSWIVYPDIPASAASDFENAVRNYDSEDLTDEDVYEAVMEIANLFPDGGTTPVITIPYNMYKALTTVAFEFNEEYGYVAWEPSANAVIRHSLENYVTTDQLDNVIGDIETLLLAI